MKPHFNVSTGIYRDYCAGRSNFLRTVRWELEGQDNNHGGLSCPMSKRAATVIVQYVLVLSAPISKNAIYVHIKMQDHLGFQKRKAVIFVRRCAKWKGHNCL